jgi:mRNA-degrading endonuclease HigB of HigAB toxin-antitoxin module
MLRRMILDRIAVFMDQSFPSMRNRRRRTAVRNAACESLESRALLTPAFSFNYTTIASDLSPTLRFFGSPNASDAPFTVIRYGEGRVTQLTELGTGYLTASNLTFQFGSNNTAAPVTVATLSEFDDGSADGIANQIYVPDANDVPRVQVLNSGVPIAEGRIQRIALATLSSGVVTSSRSVFVVERPLGTDRRLFDELFAASAGTGEIPFSLTAFSLTGPWAGVGDAEVFTSTGTSLFPPSEPNRAPTSLSLSASSVAENLPGGTVVGNLSTTDPDGPGNFSYAMVTGAGSTDNAAFTIVGNQLRTVSSFDFETKSSYSIRIQTTDSGGLSFARSLIVSVTNVNDTGNAPTDLRLTGSSVAENQPSGTLVGTLSTTDPDGPGAFQYALVTGAGSADNAQFTVSGNQLRTAASFDFESKASYSVRVQTTDSTGLTFARQFTVTVTNVNDNGSPPTSLTLVGNTVTENRPAGTVVGTFETTDPDGPGSFTYSLVPGAGSTDNSSFTIVGNQLRTVKPLNFETKRLLNIRVQTKDAAGLSLVRVFTVTVTDVAEPNLAPVNILLTPGAVAENRPVGTVVGTLKSDDPNGPGAFTYTLVAGAGSTDNARFRIVNDKLRTNAVFNYELKRSYSVRVQSRDSTGLTLQRILTVSVADVNEAPTKLTLSRTTVTENRPVGTVVGNFTTTDPDSRNMFTYSLVAGAGSTDNTRFRIVGNQLRTAAAFDFEKKRTYSVRVRTRDQNGLVLEKVFTILVSNVANA